MLLLMGNYFTQNSERGLKKVRREPHKREFTHDEIKDIINKYEYIKNNKHIIDANKLIEVMQNTDWDRIKPSAPMIEPSAPMIEPSAPMIEAKFVETPPIAIAYIVEENKVIN